MQLNEISRENEVEYALDDQRYPISHQDRQHGAVTLDRADKEQLDQYAEAKHDRHSDEQSQKQVDVQLLL